MAGQQSGREEQTKAFKCHSGDSGVSTPHNMPQTWLPCTVDSPALEVSGEAPSTSEMPPLQTPGLPLLLLDSSAPVQMHPSWISVLHPQPLLPSPPKVQPITQGPHWAPGTKLLGVEEDGGPLPG